MAVATADDDVITPATPAQVTVEAKRALCALRGLVRLKSLRSKVSDRSQNLKQRGIIALWFLIYSTV
ncbi:hypothetical protein V6N13_148981 [Hibiscus sabdariffa]